MNPPFYSSFAIVRLGRESSSEYPSSALASWLWSELWAELFAKELADLAIADVSSQCRAGFCISRLETQQFIIDLLSTHVGLIDRFALIIAGLQGSLTFF
jgi:hypothetical protein